MSIIDKKITDYRGKDVASAPDVLVGTAAENKAVFDALAKDVVVPAFNGLIDDLTALESSAHTHANKAFLDSLEALPKRTTTLVIGNSASGHTLADCDYLCTGSNARAKFAEALAALPDTGGEIKVLEGTYDFSSISAAFFGSEWVLLSKPNTKITGTGPSTVFNLADNLYYPVSAGFRLTGENCEVSNLAINASSWTSTGIEGINAVVILAGTRCRAEKLVITCTPIKHAILAASCSGSIICNNIVIGCSNAYASYGEILLAESAKSTLAIGNVITRGSDSTSQGVKNLGENCSVTGNLIV